MTQLKFGSAGIQAKEIDQSAPVQQAPVGVPAGVIGTSLKGPAFVPVTVGNIGDFYAKFGTTDGEKFGPLAMTEWMRNAKAGTYIRVLGTGDGKKRAADGSVNSAGFTVGEKQPDPDTQLLSSNQYANNGGVNGRLYFLGAFMSESLGSTVLSSAGLQKSAASAPIIRGVLMAASGVIISLATSSLPSLPTSTLIANPATSKGASLGDVTLLDGTTAKQEFCIYLNGHKGTDAQYPNVISASFDVTAPNYISNVLNTDPYKLQEAGYYLYGSYDIYPALATVTGSGLITPAFGAGAQGSGKEPAAFILSGSQAYNVGSATAPNYEAWTDRYSGAKTPWIISQRFGGKPTNLFRLHTVDDGAVVRAGFKVSVENIVKSTDLQNKFCSFDVVLRDWNDNDRAQLPLEAFRGVNLDPSSDRYIAKIIGDLNTYFDWDRTENSQAIVVDGNYANLSNLVRVEVSTEVEEMSVDPTAIPMGFRGIAHLMTSGSAPLAAFTPSALTSTSVLKSATEIPLPFRLDITQGVNSKKSADPQLYWGVQFEHKTSLTTPNASTMKDASIQTLSSFFPGHLTGVQPMSVWDNWDEPDTAANGIVDADRYNRNLFTLENIRVVTGSTGIADYTKWSNATYVRDGNITIDDVAKTRALTADDFTTANRKYLKFSCIMNGGFDGVNIFDRDEAILSDNAARGDMSDTQRGLINGPTVKAYTKAIDIMKNTTNVDIQLLAVPGIREPAITNAAINAVVDRFDALYIMDLEQKDNVDEHVTSTVQSVSVTNTINQFTNRLIDSSFVAAYFPDVVMLDPTTGTNVSVPPSVAVFGALAKNDAVGHPWFAPAGFTRGALDTVQETKVKLSKNNLDALYDAAINPLTAFPGTAVGGTNPTGGCVIWGQKTLLQSASALDRVNVRRLLITLRREIRDIAQQIIFEPNREATLAKFSGLVTPRVQRIQKLRGIDRFKVVIDSSTTTQADVENNTIRGKIYVQPTKSVEFVSLDFVVSNNIQE